ncbi:glycosyltransferase family 2 protein [Moheibacter lacus]|uniref:Glycosyltransferase n=1 Tax=Moheibacter lacus TaxID=2745851 RepID=A0A838ZIY8_9FLAO|nr:glycosyltransferase [Moheibacter lacus]MBA5628324.1 glycosyltransferase [Moheibacter lacus]
MHISVVIPLLNEQDSLEELFQRIKSVCLENEFKFEVIFIDDGSSDNSWKVIEFLSEVNPEIKGIRFRKNYGKSQALMAAFKQAQGEVFITMDADLQDFPEEIPELYGELKTKNADIISGWKQNRQDPKLTKNLPSKIFNSVARKVSGLELHDFNCGLKAYRNEVAKELELHGDMHRYIPVLAKNLGFGRIYEKRVRHQARKYGKSKFGKRRFVNGFLDLITLSFLNKFGTKPMHLFGAIGTLMFIIGFLAAVYLGLDKLFKVYILEKNARLITDNPFFYISLVAMVLGTQLFLAGFLGEILVRFTKNKQEFEIRETLNLNSKKQFS